MSNGILCSRTTFFAKMLNAAEIESPASLCVTMILARRFPLFKHPPDFFAYLIEVRIAQVRQEVGELFRREVPPLEAQEQFRKLPVEARLDGAAGVSACDGVGRDVLCHDRVRRDDCAVADVDARHDAALAPEPHVVSDDGVALARQLREVRRRVLFPSSAENVERICRNARKPVVRASHDELRAARNLAELADDEPVAELGIVEEDVALLEQLGRVRIVVVGVVAHKNVRRGDDVFKEHRCLVLVRKNLVRAWDPAHAVLLDMRIFGNAIAESIHAFRLKINSLDAGRRGVKSSARTGRAPHGPSLVPLHRLAEDCADLVQDIVGKRRKQLAFSGLPRVLDGQEEVVGLDVKRRAQLGKRVRRNPFLSVFNVVYKIEREVGLFRKLHLRDVFFLSEKLHILSKQYPYFVFCHNNRNVA